MRHRLVRVVRWQAGLGKPALLATALVLMCGTAPARNAPHCLLLTQAGSVGHVGIDRIDTDACSGSSSRNSDPIPWSELGIPADAVDQSGGLAVVPTDAGARLHCRFQRLEGEVSTEGLWLSSTLTNALNDRFRLTATSVGRIAPYLPKITRRTSNIQQSTSNIQLEETGTVTVGGQTVRFVRPGVTEEYTVSMDGVRQDFIIESPSVKSRETFDIQHSTSNAERGVSELRVELALIGARVEQADYGARLVLEHSGRKIAYSRLHVTDATGKELPARIEVAGRAGSPLPALPGHPLADGAHGVTRPALAVLVNDTDAVFPIRIDPTFSDENWISLGGIPGADDTVRAAAVDDSGNLYIGGDFTAVGDVAASRVAKWNGSAWSAMGSGLDGVVQALLVAGEEVYAGGGFTNAGSIPANRIAKWNGSSWSALGLGMNSTVYALAVSGSNVVAGGSFTTAGGNAANRIAKWDGIGWTSFGSGLNGLVLALAASGSNVYAGGSFSVAGTVSASRIAKWDGIGWSNLGLGVNSFVLALAVSGSNVYAGGNFSMAGGNPAARIARWAGGWSALGLGADGAVRTAAVDEAGNLHIGGDFGLVDGMSASHMAKWDGSDWSASGSGCDNNVNTVVVSGGDVYAGGTFAVAGGRPANRIARWDKSEWSALGAGMNSNVKALAVSGSDVYVGGSFTTAGSVIANYIAKWNGSSWSTLGAGVNGDVLALAVWGSNVYAGGSFTSAGGGVANYIAKWNGSSWSPLGSGMSSWVHSLATAGGNVYAGGAFTNAGGIAANRVARWNGSSWAALGSGMESFVYALAASETNLYAGGAFTSAGGIAANRVAQWNGTNWSAMDSGMNASVQALVLLGSDLYAGGSFTTGSVSEVNYIAKWDAGSWTALGIGVDSAVNALAVSGSNIYVGGRFTMAGESPARAIATWDGSSWSALGSGMDSAVQALAVSDNAVYAGGAFTRAGGKVSGFAAKALFVPNTSPININLSVSSLAENQPAGTVVGHFTAQDADPGDTHTFQLVTGAGDADNASFTIGNATNLLTAAVFDHETHTNHSIRVLAADSLGATYEKVFIITVTNLNESPVADAGGPYTNQLGSALNLDGSTSVDPDSGDILSYAWELNGDGDFGDATGATPVVFASSLTNLGVGLGTHIIQLRVTDGGAFMNTNATTLTVESVPVITSPPESRTNVVGTLADFVVTATGTGPLRYQWWKDETPLSGQTNDTYSIPAVSASDAAEYSAVVTNVLGSVTSVVATLTVAIPANVMTGPRLDGLDFVVPFAGTPGLTYTIEYTDGLSPPSWQKSANLTAPTADEGYGIGVFEFREAVLPVGQRYYRAVYPSY